MATYTVSTGRKTFKDATGADTYNIAGDATRVTIAGKLVSGDVINIEGLASEYTVRASGRTVTLKSDTQTITFQLSNTNGSASVRFLDGDLTATFSGKTAMLGTQKLTKKAAEVVDTALGASDSSAAFSGSGSSGTTGSTFTLTAGADTGSAFVGTSANDIFNGNGIAPTGTEVATWTVGDAIDGGAGNDTFNVTQTAAITAPTGATVANVETVNLLSGATITIDTTTGFSGLTTLNATSKGGATLTTAATTDINSTESDLKLDTTKQLIIDGGKNVTVSATGTTNNTTALTAASGAGAEILVGSTTAAEGNVNITNSFKSATDNHTSGDIFVKGGKTVSVTQKLTNSTVNVTNIQGDVSVVGDASTTSVTVKQDATATESNTGTGIVGKTAGAVTVTDKNAASTTSAGTITTVTLENAGAAVVNSGALTTLNLGGTLVTVNAGTLGALTTPANTTLALNLTGAESTGAVTIDSDITTLNIAGNTTASKLASLVASGATKINVSGNAKVSLTANTTAAVTDIVVTNTAGAEFGTALGTSVNFTGGAGADAIALTANFTKAIDMAGGDDTVTYAAQGTGGSVAAGTGTDTIIMTSAQANTASGDSTFNSKFTGFETLRVSDALAAAADLDGINGANRVILAAGANGGTINNLVSGGSIDVLAEGAGALTVGVKSALVGAADSLNLNLKSTTAMANARTVTVANVETVNINAADATVVSATAKGADAVIHTLTLAATSATTVNVAGNNGLTLTNTGNTKITKFDASGVVANDTAAGPGYAATSDTAANLAVTFTSANTTTTDTVTIIGGAGNDVLTGNASKDVINGGAGADLVNGGTGVDTITVGNGRDIVRIINNDDNTAGDIIGSGTASFDSISGFQKVATAISAVDLSSNANFQGSTAGGANLSLLNLDVTADDTGAGAGSNQALAVEADATGAGQAASTTYEVKNGILTLAGTGASTVDTLAEWLTEAAAVAATAGDVLAFQFGSDTYVFAQNGTADVFVQLVGVTGVTSLVEVSNSTTAAANAILYADL